MGWFATRGGGGGTWGIIVSTHLQLHEYPGTMKLIAMDYPMTSTLPACNATVAECEEYREELAAVAANFYLDFYVNPDALTGLDPEVSTMCGSPEFTDGDSFCFGESGDAFISVWKTRLMQETPRLVETGVPEAMIEIAEASPTVLIEVLDYVSLLLAVFPEGHRHHGKGADLPPPTRQNYKVPLLNPLIPKSVVLENRDFWVPYLLDQLAIENGPYVAHAEKTDDQLASLSETHRTAAFMANIPHTGDVTETIYKMLFEGLDFNGDFPGLFGSNHLNPIAMGPVKTDWTKPCPTDWTMERRAEECFSPQEAVYGTKRLRELEEIKGMIDPQNLFNCFTCISNPTTESMVDEVEENSGVDAVAQQFIFFLSAFSTVASLML